jgi:hypothetical protein
MSFYSDLLFAAPAKCVKPSSIFGRFIAEQKKTIYRDSGTGRITTRADAESHPETTEKERVRTGTKRIGRP